MFDQIDDVVRSAEQRAFVLKELANILKHSAQSDDAFFGSIEGLGNYVRSGMYEQAPEPPPPPTPPAVAQTPPKVPYSLSDVLSLADQGVGGKPLSELYPRPVNNKGGVPPDVPHRTVQAKGVK